MIRERNDDIISSGAEAMVNPVNCKGVSGAGLAFSFKGAFPANHAAYARECRDGLMHPGKVFEFRARQDPPLWIFNFPTKDDWRAPAKMVWIDQGLYDLGLCMTFYKPRSIAIPALGCGLGGLPWKGVRLRIIYHMRPFEDVDVMLFPPR